MAQTVQPVTMISGLAAHIREDQNSGEAVLWIHGYTMDGTIWRDVWSHLPGYLHVGLDLPGHGQSPPITPDMTLPDIGLLIGNVARAVGARKLVAISFGGMMALQAAIDNPDQFDTVVLGSPAIGGGAEDPVAGRKHMELMHTFALRGAGPWMAPLWMQWPPDIFKGASTQPGLWQMLSSVVQRHTWAELKHRGLAQIVRHPQTAVDFQRIRANVVLFHGQNDMPIFVSIAEQLARELPSCRLIVLPDTGHLTILESPHIAVPFIARQFQLAASLST